MKRREEINDIFLVLATICVLISKVGAQAPLVVNGAGATFPENVYRAWASSFIAERPEYSVFYNATGSGNGQQQLINGTVVFAGSDSALTDAQYSLVPDLQMLPILAGGIVALSKSFDQQLTFSQVILKQINKIKYWDDEAIVELNPTVQLPHVLIKIIYRLESSGTTNVFTTALAKFSEEWKTKYGTVSTWPADLQAQKDVYYGATGNDGVFTLSSIIPYSISYISYSFAYNSLADQYCAKLINKAGNSVIVTPTSVTAATSDADFNSRFAADITDSSNPEAWPISTFTYIVLRTSSTNVSRCEEFSASLSFFDYAIKYYTPQLLIGLNGLAASSVYNKILDIMGTITCNGESSYDPNSPPSPAPAPSPLYYHNNLPQYSSIEEVSYSNYYNDIGSIIDAASAKEYEPSTISSLYSSNVVYDRYYENGKKQSSDSVKLPISPFLTMILFIISSITFGRNEMKGKIIFFTLFTLLILISNSSAEITEIRIAGLFPFTGYLSEYGSSEEAATRISVSDLNEDFLPAYNYSVVFQSFDTRSSPSGSTQSLISARNSFNMFGIIGCHDSYASSSVALSSSLYYFPQISYGSQANFLSSSSEYPFFARVIPPYKSEGIALSSLIKLYGWNKLGLIITSDDYGTDTANAFREALPDRTISFVQFSPGEKKLDSQMSVLRDALVRVIVALPGTTADAQTLFMEADRYHLIGDDFVWFGGSFVGTSSLYYNSTSQSTNNILKSFSTGVISLKLKGGFGTEYEKFLDKWETLNPRLYSGSGKRSIPFYAPYAYDAMQLFMRTFVKEPLASLPQFLLNLGNTTFDGLTGHISLGNSTERLGIYDIVNQRGNNDGDRGWIVIGSWDEEIDLLSNSSSGFNFKYDPIFYSGSSEPPQPEVRPEVKYWVCESGKDETDPTGKIRLDPPGPDAKNIAHHYYCDNFIDCHNFSDESSGSCASNYLAVFIVFGIIAGILIIITFLLIPYTIIYGFIVKKVRIRTASPPFLIILLVSIIVGYGSIYAWFGQPNAVACGFQPWLLGLSVISMISVLVAKNFRIWRIFQNPLKKKQVYDYQVLIFYVILMIPAVFILFLWTLISTPTALLKDVSGTDHWVCDTGGFTGPPGGIVFFSIFVGYSGFILLIGAVVSFLIRKVPSLFNESRLIAISIYNILFLAVIIIPIFFVLLKFNPFIGWIIRTLAILYAFTTTLCLMFVPKVAGMIKDFVTGKELTSSTMEATTSSVKRTGGSSGSIISSGAV